MFYGHAHRHMTCMQSDTMSICFKKLPLRRFTNSGMSDTDAPSGVPRSSIPLEAMTMTTGCNLQKEQAEALLYSHDLSMLAYTVTFDILDTFSAAASQTANSPINAERSFFCSVPHKYL